VVEGGGVAAAEVDQVVKEVSGWTLLPLSCILI